MYNRYAITGTIIVFVVKIIVVNRRKFTIYYRLVKTFFSNCANVLKGLVITYA